MVLEQEGLKIIVAAESVGFLKGTKLDYVETLHASGFKFENPNAKVGCGCGNSFG